MILERHWSDVLVNIVIYLILTLLAILCILPFWHMIAMSFSGSTAVASLSVSLWPVDFNLQNYGFLLQRPLFFQTAGVSVLRVVMSVCLQLLVGVLAAYPLSRDHIHMPGRTVIKVVILFFLMFNGGLIPALLAYNSLGLIDNFFVLVLPGVFNLFNTILIINYFRGIPRELEESALLDGASHLDVLRRIFLPLSTPVLATCALFTAVAQWNDWFSGVVFIRSIAKMPLQSYLYLALLPNQNTGIVGDLIQKATEFKQATPEALRAALIVVAAIPIIAVYPFVQRYFVTGLTLGSIKE
jgi:putative aldouronate transport system permease protein